MPGSDMCLRLKQTMKINNEHIQSATRKSWSLKPRQDGMPLGAKAHYTNWV